MLPSTRTVFSVICGFQFIAMALLIIGCVTAPVFKQIGLSKSDGTTYGVFGYCESGKDCSKVAAIYDASGIGKSTNWKMGDSARSRLSKILIVTPIAAGLNFISFLSSLLSFVVGLISGSTSGVLFTLNLTMTVIGFTASGLVCIVVFLLFYPNVTWCAWLLIPAAALQLIVIPLVFVAHSSGGRSKDIDESDDELAGIVQQNAMLDSEFESPNKPNGFYKDINNTTDSLSEKPLIVPSYGFNNYQKQESVVRVDTGTTDHSTVEKDPYDIETETKSHTAFSAINGPNGGPPKAVSLSMASSEYSNNYAHGDLQKQPRDVLEDIINDSLSQDEVVDSHMRTISDNGSDFTSISQRAARQQPAGPMPYVPQQQRMPPNVRSAGPDPTEMLLQNNPNFLQTNPRRMQHHHQPNQFQQNPYAHRQPNGYGGFHNNAAPQPVAPMAPSTSTHYKPAYKRVGARSNMIPPASSINGSNPYQFR